MEITDKLLQNVRVIHLKGRFDANSWRDVEAYSRKFVDDGEKKIVFDMKKVDHISSAGLRSVLALVKDLKADDGNLFLAELQPIVYEVFDIVGLVTVLKIFKSVDEAVDALG